MNTVGKGPELLPTEVEQSPARDWPNGTPCYDCRPPPERARLPVSVEQWSGTCTALGVVPAMPAPWPRQPMVIQVRLSANIKHGGQKKQHGTRRDQCFP